MKLTQTKIIYNLILSNYENLINSDYLNEGTQKYLTEIGKIKEKLENKLKIAHNNTQPVLIKLNELKE